MRTSNFRDDVLWAVCYKMGLEPRDDLSPDQALAYTSFINSRLRRAFEFIDYPEWTITEQRTPDASHWVALEQAGKTPIAHVFKVFLVDPDTNRGPIETPFRLGDKGVHVGFEHGSSVWIKFNTRAPKFVATDVSNTFPYVLTDLVVQGAYADALRDDGQHEKAAAEEQLAAAMFAELSGRYAAPPIEQITSQKPAPVMA